MADRRLPAEWEPQRFVQFTFPRKDSDWGHIFDEAMECFRALITKTAQYVPALVVCTDLEETSALLKEKTKHPVFFARQPSNDIWARDHGPITVMENGRPLLLDFTFNGWNQIFESSMDNEITRGIHTQGVFSDNLQTIDFVLEGGGIESDGKGTLLTTAQSMLSRDRKPHMSRPEIEAFLKKIFGLKRVLWLEHGAIAGDDTDSHIDTLARFCDEQTIAYVKCDDPKDGHFKALQEMERQLRTFKTLKGKPYELIPLPWPAACYDRDNNRLPATYANFLITNGAVLAPAYGIPQDREAVKVLRGIFPKRNVVGVNCIALINQRGSLHCATMQYPSAVNTNWP